MSRGGTGWRALWIALGVMVAGAVMWAPTLARTLWSGPSITSDELELRVVLTSLPIAALIAVAIVMERAVRRTLR